MEASGDDDILTFTIKQGRMGVYNALARRTTAGTIAVQGIVSSQQH